jgi:hypothetical protein
VACLVPTASSRDVVLPHPLVLSTSQDCSASLTSTCIRLSGKGSLLVQTYNPSLGVDRLLDAIFLQSSSPARLVFCNSAPGQLILASPKHVNPVSAAIIPLVPPTPSNVSILRGTLATLSRSNTFTVYLPSSDDAFFIPADQKSISLTIPISGVELLLSPSYTLSNNINPSWDISFVTPYSLSLGDSLPTPPPSPRFPPLQLSRQKHLKTNYSGQRSQPITRLVPYVLVGLIVFILEAIWTRIFGGGLTGSKHISGRGRAPRRDLRLSAPTSKGSSEIFVNVEGMVSFLVRHIDLETDAVGQIRVELDGKRVLPEVAKLAKDDGTMVLSLNARGTGSKLKVSSIAS